MTMTMIVQHVVAVMISLMMLTDGIFPVAAHPVKDGLLPNGNFESPPNSSKMKGNQIRGRKALRNWEISGYVEYIKSGHKEGDMHVPVPEGSCAVRLGNEASIKQTLQVIQGTYYSITLSAARTCAQEEQLNITVTPDSSLISIQTVYSSTGWNSYAWAFVAQSNIVDLIIHNTGVNEDPACGPVIDAIAIITLRSPPKIDTDKNLLMNPNFEEGPYVFPSEEWGVLILPSKEEERHSPLPGWTVLSSKAVRYIDSAHFKVPSGKCAVEFVGGLEGVLAQTVETEVGTKYKLEFLAGDAGNGCKGPMELKAYAAPNKLEDKFESRGIGEYKKTVMEFVAMSSSTRVVFHSGKYHTKEDGSMCGPVVDDVYLSKA